MLIAVRIAGNIERDRSVLAKQASVQRNDIGLGTTQHQHAAQMRGQISWLIKNW
ncbi:MAG: hypothetical protein ACLTXI_06135 [Collinsella sp.]